MNSRPSRLSRVGGLALTALTVAALPAPANAAPQWTPTVNVAGPTDTAIDVPGASFFPNGAVLSTLARSEASAVSFSGAIQTQTLTRFDLPAPPPGLTATPFAIPPITALSNGTVLAPLALQDATTAPYGPFRMYVAERSQSGQSTDLAPVTPTPPTDEAEVPLAASEAANGDVTVIYIAGTDSSSTARGRAIASPGIRLMEVVRKAGATQWSTPTTIVDPITFNGSLPAATSTADGRLVVMWGGTDAATSNGVVNAVIRDTSGAWGAPSRVTNPANPVNVGSYLDGVRLASDDRGNVTAAWSNTESSDTEIWTASLSAGSTSWSTPFRLDQAPEPGYSHRPEVALAVNHRGDAVVSWPSQTMGPTIVNVATRPVDGAWTARAIPDPDTTGVDGGRRAMALSVDSDGAITVAGLRRDFSSGTTEVVALRAPSLTAPFGAPQLLDSSQFAPSTSAFVPFGSAANSDGSLSVAWVAQEPSDGLVAIRSTTLDATGPAQTDVAVPATTTVKTDTPFSLTAQDALSGTGATTWSFGDGSSATGTSVRHSYAAAGTYTVKATSVDSLGNARSVTREIRVTGSPTATCGGDRDGRKVTVKCDLGYDPGTRVKINGRLYRIKSSGSFGTLRGKARTSTSTGKFTLVFTVRSARKGRYALVITPKGWPRQTVTVKL